MLFSVSLPVFVPTHDSHALSRLLALPVSRGLKPYAISKAPPSSFLDSLVQDPRGPARLLRIREENLHIFVIAILASFIVVVVVTSSVGISIATLRSVAVVSPESLFFRVLTVARFYLPNRCLLAG